MQPPYNEDVNMPALEAEVQELAFP
jgi:hypothetical protein